MHHREVGWVEGKLSKLLSEIEKVKRIFQRAFARHCRSGEYTSKLYLLDHLAES